MRTRSALIRSALEIMGEEKSLDSLSLREVAKQAEIVPAAFYRHFKDMEELGIALVDDVSLQLRALLREARKDKTPFRSEIDASLDIFFNYVKTNRLLFRFITREKVGGNKRIRNSIRNEMAFFSAELATDMKDYNSMPGLNYSELETLSELVITTIFTNAGDFLDINEHDHDAQKKLKMKSTKQLRLIYRGAALRFKQARRKKTYK